MTDVLSRLYQKIRLKFRRELLAFLQPCRDITALMSESLDHRLNIFKRAKLKLHMMVCAWCKLYLQQIGLMQTALRQSEKATLTDNTLSAEARQRILERLEEDSHRAS